MALLTPALGPGTGSSRRHAQAAPIFPAPILIPAEMPGAPPLVEPVTAGVLVTLINRWLLSGACCRKCCGNSAGEDAEDDSGDSSSNASVAPEVGVVADADCHQGAHHVDAAS